MVLNANKTLNIKILQAIGKGREWGMMELWKVNDHKNGPVNVFFFHVLLIMKIIKITTLAALNLVRNNLFNVRNY